MSKIERLSAARAIFSKVGLDGCLLYNCQQQHLQARMQREKLHSHNLSLKSMFTGLLGIKSQPEESQCCYSCGYIHNQSMPFWRCHTL